MEWNARYSYIEVLCTLYARTHTAHDVRFPPSVLNNTCLYMYALLRHTYEHTGGKAYIMCSMVRAYNVYGSVVTSIPSITMYSCTRNFYALLLELIYTHAHYMHVPMMYAFPPMCSITHVHACICDPARINQPYAAIYKLRVRG